MDDHQLQDKHDSHRWWQQRLLDKRELKQELTEEDVSDYLASKYDRPNLVLTKDDFQKRNRVKHPWGLHELCIAKRADGEQCTRKMKDLNAAPEERFCGTHIKAQPHGLMRLNEANPSTVHKVMPMEEVGFHERVERVEVWVQEIKGINYYIDAHNNVYKPDDIIANKHNPSVIAKWGLTPMGSYCIPNFNI